MPTPKKNDATARIPTALIDRRDALAALGGIGPLALLGCSSSMTSTSSRTSSAGQSGDTVLSTGDAAVSTMDASIPSDAQSVEAAAPTCHEIPGETSGPYADVNNMILDAIWERVDITEGRPGTPLTLSLRIVDVADGCTPVPAARIMIWQCDANGVYSEYAVTANADKAQNDIGSTSTTYLRGWQETDETGIVTFTTIYPGWYTPRVTHIHIMVYNASQLAAPVKTTQFAFPDSVNSAVYAQASLYPKGPNSVTNATDMVFGAGDAGDAGDEYLVATIAADPTNGGYTASIDVGIQPF
jgi:protocatechuate 3,4-dioxygenase beta subunit